MPNGAPIRSLRPGTPAEAGMDPTRLELIRARCREWVDAGVTPSLCVLAARRGVIVLEEAFGILRHGEREPLRTDAIFELASFTKSFTAAAVLRLVDDGRVGLTRAAADYLPDLDVRGKREILVADLLTHTAGIEDALCVPDDEAFAAGRREAAPGQHPLHAAVVKATARAPLASKPGATMRYANRGYSLLAELVCRVSGRSFAGFLEEELFRPLGMSDTHIGGPGHPAQERRVVYAAPRRPPPPWIAAVPPENRPDASVGAAGAVSTARDVARFGQMLLNGGTLDGARVLSEAAVAAMTRSQIPPGTPAVWGFVNAKGERIDTPMRGGDYGYGVFRFVHDRSQNMNGSTLSPASFGHSGFSGCTWWADPEREIVGVYLSAMRGLTRAGWHDWNADLFMNLVQAAAVG